MGNRSIASVFGRKGGEGKQFKLLNRHRAKGYRQSRGANPLFF